MKILVIDDNENNRIAAEAQLSGHDVTVVGRYDEAQKLINGVARRLADWSQVIEGKQEFDVVLADLLMPASGQAIGENRHLIGQEMPVGIFLALLAAKNGAKFVAVFTDSDHHSHPASACFDAFNIKGEELPSPFMVEGAKFLLVNNRCWINDFRCGDFSKVLEYEERCKMDKADYTRAKNWGRLLKYLVGPSE